MRNVMRGTYSQNTAVGRNSKLSSEPGHTCPRGRHPKWCQSRRRGNLTATSDAFSSTRIKPDERKENQSLACCLGYNNPYQQRKETSANYVQAILLNMRVKMHGPQSLGSVRMTWINVLVQHVYNLRLPGWTFVLSHNLTRSYILCGPVTAASGIRPFA